MGKSNFSSTIRLCTGAFLCLLIGLSASAYAEVTLAENPLFLTTQVKPNIVLTMDDSGSMDGEVLFPTNDGAAWWNTSNNTFTGGGGNDAVLSFNEPGAANGTWKKFVYLFPNGQNGSYDGRRRYGDSTNDHYAIPPIAQFAWARSSDFNKAYFDPTVSYLPWPATPSRSYSNSTPSAAKYDPEFDPNLDLTAISEVNTANWRFRFYDGMKVESDLKLYDGSQWLTVSAAFTVDGSTQDVNDGESYGVGYFPATFYLSKKLPDSFGFNDNNIIESGFSPGAALADLWKYEIKSDNFDSSEAYNTAIQNFANWFTYYRKRHLATRGGIAQSFQDIKSAQVGYFRINDRDGDITMRDMTSADSRNAFFDDIYSSLNGVGFGGTPNREAIDHAGNRFRNQSDIIQYECQSNAAILFTDGYSNASTGSGAGNADGAKGVPYADAVSNTLADIAMKYYDGDGVPLRSGTGFSAGRVPVPSECSLTNRDASLDCKRDLHMNTYAVTLGTSGIVYDPSNPVDPYKNPPTWPTTFVNRNPSAVDDLWHATINGRGALLNANTPAEISLEMKKILDAILRRVGSASSVAANSTRLDTGTRIYQAKFDSTDWSGEVLAYSIGAAGDIASLQWTTNNTIPLASNRNIKTWNGTGGQDFTRAAWITLSDTQKTALGSDTEGKDRIDWIRGEGSQEIDGGGEYRNRQKLLGDVINSDPVFSGAEDFRYQALSGVEGETYQSFVNNTKASRAPLLMVGANDGMLHGLDADTGVELFGYVPGSIYPKLNRLTSPTYTHEALVDGTVGFGDAYLDSTWKTIALGSTGAGAATVFALDVTNPSGFAVNNVLWEKTGAVDTNDKIGVGISQPSIVRLANGQWGAVFGNGFNSGDNVKLILLNLSTGALIKSIDTGLSGAANGLGPLSPVDVNGDRITDYIYAGDLQGNMWKFDISNTSTSQWGVAFKTGSTPNPLFKATVGGVAQPITSRPVVGRHPDGGYMVYFGTGSYFREGDNIVGDDPQLQRFYGIRDNGATVSVSNLIGQTIIYQSTISGFGPARAYSDNVVDYSTKKGWYLDLKFPVSGAGKGERVVSTPILRFGRIIFTSIIPSEDPCGFGGTSWINELDAISGRRLTYSVFDINGDGRIDNADFIELDNGSKIPLGGKGFDEIVKTPGIVGAGELEYKYTSGSSGTLGVTLEAGDQNPIGRQSWKQLR
jgi:type IV pilus assembly protein PilY1